jgi:hypothetical protein
MEIAGREYITGLDRNDQHLVAHIYTGTFGEPGDPMCVRGWNRSDGDGYSIFRNNVGKAGICGICMRRALEKREPIPSRPRKTRWI